MKDNQADAAREKLVAELVGYFQREGFEVHGARGVEGHNPPPLIRNDGFGSMRPCRPDVVAFDPTRRRVVFGLVRAGKGALDSEESLEEYNVLLDHNAGRGDQASALYVLLPAVLMEEFTALVTHYIHREYWSRVIPVVSGSA